MTKKSLENLSVTDRMTNREETKSPGNPVVVVVSGGTKHFLML